MEIAAYINRPSLSLSGAAVNRLKLCLSPATNADVLARVNITPVVINISSAASDVVLEQRISNLESLISGLEMYTVQAPVQLPDNVESTVTISVPGLKASKLYTLLFNSKVEGLSAVLRSWSDNQALVSIVNNTGTNVSDTLSFTINQILTNTNI